MVRRFVGMLVLSGVILAGCARPRIDTGDNEPLVVEVSLPVKKPVLDYLDFTGRLDSVNSVDIRARVTGYIMESPFKEGDVVKKDEVLYVIDKRPYKAKLDDAAAQLALQKARLKLARADNLRAQETAKTPGAISKQELDKYQASEEEAGAAVNAAAASMEIFKLDLDWCTVASPIDGRISRYFFTKGNLITQDTTVLTTVVSEDPIYAYFDMDERSILRILRELQSGRLKARKTGEIPVLMSLADETTFPHKGVINFFNNRIEALTGTLTARGKFDNPFIDRTRRLLAPGMFVRIRLPIGNPRPAILVADRALVTDQGLKNIFIVDKDDKVQYRRVEMGPLQADGLRVILEGLTGDERVLLSGLQVVRPGMVVKPETIAMPVIQPPVDPGNAKQPAPPKKGS